MSPVLRRLGVTTRRPRRERGDLAQQIATTLRRYGQQISRDGLAIDLERALLSARAAPAADQRDQLERIDAALREHDHRLTADLAADVARALRVECGRAERLAQQSEGFEAELIAVDEALAKAGATPVTDRVEAIRALVDPAHVCTCGACLDRRARLVESEQQRRDEDVADAAIACSRSVEVMVDCGDDDDHDGPCWPSPYSLARQALDGAARNRPDLLGHMRAVWSAIVNAPSGAVFVVGQLWLGEVLAAAQHLADEPLSPDDVMTLVRGLEKRRVAALRESDSIARNLDWARYERDIDRATSKALARRVAWLEADRGDIDPDEPVALHMTDGDDAPTELRALARELHRWAPNLDALAIRDRLLDVARLLDGTASPEREATHLAARLAAAAVGTAARRCRCTGRQLGMVGLGGVGQSCVVDPRCPEHSPAWRYGGRPVQPLALPASTTAPRSRYGFDALDVWDGSVAPGGWVCDVCRMPVESEPCREHQPKAHAEMCAEAQAADPWGELGWMLHDDERDQVTRAMTAAGDPGPVLATEAGRLGVLVWTASRVYGCDERRRVTTMPRYPQCAADLDGATCARPAGHTEPCRPGEDRRAFDDAALLRATSNVARCAATAAPRGGRCRGVAGHHGGHDWSWHS